MVDVTQASGKRGSVTLLSNSLAGDKASIRVMAKATEQESFTNPVLDGFCFNSLFSDFCCWYNRQPTVYNIPVNNKVLPGYKNIESDAGLFHVSVSHLPSSPSPNTYVLSLHELRQVDSYISSQFRVM